VPPTINPLNNPAAESRVAGSFRDPSGFLFQRNSVLYRQVNQRYASDYDALIASGLYRTLTDAGLLIRHDEVDAAPQIADLAYKVICPTRVGFISYPYEWSFSQLKDAALLTLEIQRIAVEHDMVLKDASAYNVQFHEGRPIFIDTLSFERYTEGEPWIAYRQFVQHFLAPLALMAMTDVRLVQLMRTHIDGIPVDLASKLLPWRSRFRFTLLTHIHMLGKSLLRHGDDATAEAKQVKKIKVSKLALRGLIDNLTTAVRKLHWRPGGTEWGDYYEATNYTDDAMQRKHALVEQFIDEAKPQSVWDLGANTGEFSRIASDRHVPTIAFDIDPTAVEKNYRRMRVKKEPSMLPLVMDLTNPSPSLGWRHRERDGLTARGPVDLAMGLALVHHLAISNNVPLDDVANFFADVSQQLIIEFVPKEDSQVKRLLATREDIFPHYTREGFEAAFTQHFDILRSEPIADSHRMLYLMKRTNEV